MVFRIDILPSDSVFVSWTRFNVDSETMRAGAPPPVVVFGNNSPSLGV